MVITNMPVYSSRRYFLYSCSLPFLMFSASSSLPLPVKTALARYTATKTMIRISIVFPIKNLLVYFIGLSP